MTRQEIEAIVGGYHADPFGILGPHATPGRQTPRWQVRAFLPQAAEAQVIRDGVATPMKKIHPTGFFFASLPGEPAPYRIRLKTPEGEVSEFDDPYRFPLLLTDFELHLWSEGANYESYRSLGAHPTMIEGASGVRFAVWAPNAELVSLVGDFNQWDTRRHPMRLRSAGIWEIFIPGLKHGDKYKYFVKSRQQGYQEMKTDPYAFYCETPPRTGSIVWDLSGYQWNDGAWMEARAGTDWLKRPVSIYEVHLESWLRAPGGQFLSYRELARSLVGYAKKMGYTHLEMLPIMEYPYSGSWGYQVVGYYAPTSRFGTPDDFKHLVDCCHQAGLGVIVDWVPGHFPKDAHGLAYFDGTSLYEHADPRKGEHHDWGTKIFNYGRNEVRGFLISNALFWLKEYHIDSLRVDAVASMLYLDYSRKPGEWIPNQFGGRENLEAIDLLRRFNELAHQVPGAFTAAEESTAWPGVSKPVYLGGLGFTMKWNMGWMHDMLRYFSQEPVHRKFHHQDITFSLLYAFHENFVLPISHDEVVHGKKALIAKMPGDEWQRFANARAFLGYMWAHPGKKLLFMGSELGQYEEWDYNSSVRWELLQFDPHRRLQTFVRELNRFYREQPAMYEVDFHWSGFEWVDFRDADNSVIAFLRRAQDPEDFLLFCSNFTPVPRQDYRVGVPAVGFYEEVFNTDAAAYGGSGLGNAPGVESEPVAAHGREQSIPITLPPLAVVVFKKRS